MLANRAEDKIAGVAPSFDLETKQQKKEQGRQRALDIALSRQATSRDSNAEPGHANAKRARRKSARHGARNQHRHKHFAKWVLARFPHVLEDCSEDSADGPSPCHTDAPHEHNSRGPRHILDVAGGKGELSARLSLCHSLHVVMIDPRRADIPSVYMNSVVPKLPKKWQASVRARLQQSPTFVHDELEKRFSQLVEPFAAPPSLLSSRAKEPGKSCFYPEAHVDEAVRGASLLVGLHADGATEAIVDAALLFRKPFVVVPCCVFPNLFKERYIHVPTGGATADGGDEERRGEEALKERRVPVRTHEQFCRYLLEKDPRFVMEVLPFEGRNIAIWWDGK